MEKKLCSFPKGSLLLCLLILLVTYSSNAQLSNYQQVTTKCYTGPTLSMGNTTGTLVGNINFSPTDIPLGHKIADVIVEIVWSKTDDGSCTATTGVPADLSHVGFVIQAPFGTTRYLATSALTGPFASPLTSSSFTGLSNIIQDTIVFKDGASSLLPAGLPVLGRDTVRPNNNPLAAYYGANPHGSWSVGGIDDAPLSGPQLCIHSYCITIVTCDANQLKASCKTNPVITLGATGTHNFDFLDLDSISDVSCLVKNITFSPASVNCSDAGTTVPVTMTIRDHLDSIDHCTSMVSVLDNTTPVIANCFPSIWGDLYLGTDGRDTFWADSIVVVDNCGPLIKQVRPFSGGPWRPYMVFNCVTGFQQFSAQITDPSGNVHSCNLIVNVRDTVAPTAVCGQDTVFLTTNLNGATTVSAVDLDGGSFDICPPVIGRWIGHQFAPPPVYTCADLGIDTVRLIVADASGNLDTCDNAIVVVVDTIPPTAICRNDTIYLNASGNATAYAANINNNSVDTCGIDSININGAPSILFDCSHVNTAQPAVLNVFDASGNTDSCIGWVTVMDTLPPIANCKNASLYIDGTGTATLSADSLNNNSIDLCTGTHLSFEIAGNPTATFDCSNLATNPNTVVLTVIDSFGNSSTCSATVTLWDTISPVANCAASTIYLNQSGIATLSATQLSAGSWDNCSIADSFVNVVGNGFTTFNCSAIFTPQTATLIVQDAQGNSNSCSATVDVIDTIAPTALCEASITAQLNATGLVTITPASIDSNSTDNCGLVEYLINNTSSVTYTCADLGTQVAHLSVRDSSGNITTCASQVVVQDNIAPIVSCQTTTAYLNLSGVVSVVPNDVLVYPATSDNCGISTVSFSGGSNVTYTCDSLGTRFVSVLVTDNFGNTSNCVTTITVLDTVAPVASCRPVPYTVQLDSFGVGCVTPLDIDNGSFDLCHLDTMLVNGVDSLCFNCSSLGTSAVTLSLIDSSGNQSSCLANVIVADVVNPTAICHDTTIYLGATGVVNIFPADIDAGSTDNCTFSRSINGLTSMSYTCSQAGIHSVQLIITDNSNNVAQCPANITIVDSIVPVASCITPAQLNVYLDSSCFVSIPAAMLNNGSTDNCNLTASSYTVGGVLNTTFNATNLSTNPNVVTLTVTDPSGNTSSCHTSVIVRDTIKPIVTCVADTVQLDVTGNATVLPSMVNGGSIDNCTNGLVYTLNGQGTLNFDCTNLGLNNVTLTAMDSSGNASSCATTIWVEDDIAPNASCRPTMVLNLNSGGTFGVLDANLVDLGSSDNCTIVSTLLSQDTFTCNDIYTNPHTVTLLVMDASGNVDSCTSQITVADNTFPTASCQTATVYLGTGIVNVTPATVLVPPTGDNCNSLTATFAGHGNNIVYTCDSIGIHSVQVIVTDISGNTASCVTSITVLDTVPPVANCSSLPYTVQLDTMGNGWVTPQDINSGSFDFCGIHTMLVNGTDSFAYSCANTGTTAVTLSVLDGSGNQNNCVANIIVNDPINPTALCHDTMLYLGNTGITTITPNLIDAGSSDNCAFTATVNGLPSVNFNCSQVGTNTVQLIITDISGNTTQCAANITILDTIPPTANCIGPGILTVYLDNTCFASIPSTLLNNGSTDNCSSSLNFTVGGLPNATFNATNVTNNPNPITLVVRDATGNTSTCITTVIVTDTINPIVNCRPDTIQLTGPNVVVNPLMINAGTSDNCSVPNLTINGQPSLTLDCSHLGATNVTLIGTDISGNVDSCTTTVYLEDVAAPVANCHLNTTVFIDPSTNLATLQVMDVDNGSIDNCSITNYSLSTNTFDCSALAVNPHAVKMFVTDQSGNRDSCITQVTVRDTISPTAVCLNDTLFFSGTTIHVNAIDFDGGSVDNCALQGFSLSQDTFNCPDIGLNSIVLTVTDSSGNTGNCIAEITVLDTTASAFAGNAQILCTTDSTYLSASSVSGTLLGTWTTHSGATITNPNDPNSLVYNLPVGMNVFYWTLSNATCSNLSTDSVIIHVILPSPDLANAGLDQNWCEDTTINLAASPLTTSTGQWLQSTAQANTGVLIDQPADSVTAVNGLVAGNSYVFVWELTNSFCGVHATDTIIVTIDAIPTDQAIAGPDVTCSPDSLNMAAMVSTLGQGLWSTPSSAIIVDPDSATTLVKNFTQDTSMMIWSLSNGVCTNYSSDTMYIILDDVWPRATMDSFNLIPDGSIATVDAILNDTLPPNWDIMIHTPMIDGQMTSLGNGQFEVDINGAVLNQYFIYEICNSDCPVVCDTALVTIGIQPPGDCYTPTAFTPNGDGRNDFFVIPCLSNTNEKGALYIFNRWGNVVFETDNYQSDWDGTHRNQPLPDGVYFYILQIEGKQPQNGSIEIKR
ncbi:gliding motility-associated C-terminal domain-containing protein [Aureispira anguillae]|uniref:Gliding motility-associated C-terminal domain-containing protein n=1 Tax=Aureispira anguillae TaxID=2864201 RepID=A0A916DVA2_9BACT|nr:gliding motility-associated C-terminal domain-containing protein [Aureispira anguillae]BDS13330.1 gliding motility-associated C-terminal domain-containing protein [Aureispira anguillae]